MGIAWPGFLVRLLLIGVVIYGVAFALLYVMQRSMLFAYGSEQSDPAEGMVEKTVTTPDGVDLIVWAADAGPTKPVVVYFQGNAGTVGLRTPRFEWMREQGWGVVSVGVRGSSGSGGSPSEEGHAIDARAVYDALPELLGRPVERGGVVLYGESLGTGIAVTLANERKVGAVILETPYAAMDDLAQEKFPVFPIKLFGAVRDPFRSIDRIKGIDAPLLIFHGTNDVVIPIHHAKRLFEAAENPKWYRWIEGGGHNDLWQRGATDAIAEFMERYF